MKHYLLKSHNPIISTEIQINTLSKGIVCILKELLLLKIINMNINKKCLHIRLIFVTTLFC